MSHEVDFEIIGNEMQIAEIELDPNESVVAEAGAMMYMDNSIQMETIFGDGSDKGQSGGLMGKLMGAGKRVLTGESLFMTMYTNIGVGKQRVAFAAPYPGKIIPLDLNNFNNKIICQKDSFLCAAKGVAVGIELTRKIGAGFFGGEGFILQKLEGDGLAFVHAGGTIIKRDLSSGEKLRVDTGCVVAFTRGVDYDIELAKGVKSAIFGGEGLFLTTLTGPGTVWLQSIPFNRLAAKIIRMAPSRKEEGSILGGLGNLIDGN
ncbi:TIGR00266 family protein [Clostridium sp. SHJSY1]|uniref:TIGR00266 family protein n=1 Tax=Clostridium sp. SHJSY1 TaxID=2942483 RepID=UPI00287574BC|nr:TIGR00266 family protein [Clostridium sp. SHJSY1]MDS0528435.1 TIGR00266 family protein [Clostridium sp. SHJSY1]